MNDWTHGYNASQGYTHGFYPEMAPDWIDLCILASGSIPPQRGESGHYRYLDMGCGQGFGLCLLAAANPQAEFVGIDFIGEHIEHANELALATGLTNVRFLQEDFMKLAGAWPEDIGQFEYVALHGIYSWIAPPVREALVRCLGDAIAPGGALYNGYNTQPGWVSTLPFQHMAKRLQEVTGKPDDKAIEASVALFEDIFENSKLGENLPGLKLRVASVKRTEHKAYLAQEYLNGAWYPFWFSDVAKELAAIQLDYVGTATAIEQLLPGILPPAARKLVTAQKDPIFAEEVLDCVTGKAFRRDIFRRQAPRVKQGGRDPLMDAAFCRASTNIPSAVTVRTTVGDLAIPPELYTAILQKLGDGSMKLADLAALPALAGATREDLVRTIMMMLQTGLISVAPPTAIDPETAQRFNALIARVVSQGATYRHIALPALASGAPLTDIDCMMIDAYLSAPDADQVAVAEGLFQRLHALGYSLMHEGETLEGDALAQRIVDLAGTFFEKDLPRWHRLGAIV